MLKNTKGIDVSHHQGEIDWKKVKADGVKFAVIRAGFGNSAVQKDKQFEVNMKGALGEKIPVGAYWFSYAVDAKDALKEAEVCHSILKSYKNKLILPVFFDFEYDSETYNGEITYTRQGRTDIIRAFCEAMKGYGYKVGYYTNRDYIQNRIDKTRLPYDLWLADYSGGTAAGAGSGCGIWLLPGLWESWKQAFGGSQCGICPAGNSGHCKRSHHGGRDGFRSGSYLSGT